MKGMAAVTIKIGIIGTGWFSNEHANILANMEDVSVSAFVGTSLPKAENMAQRYAGAKAYSELERMLDEMKPDAVYVCVPPFAHGEIEKQLIARNIPFLVEKPLSTSLDIPSNIADAVNKNKLITSVGYHYRYTDAVIRAQELVQNRTIGMALGYWMGGMPLVDWWRKQEGSGGQFIEQTTHIVDMLRYVVGEVDEVYAAYSNQVMHHKYDGVTVPDVGTVTMKLVNGAVATISNTCILPAGEKVGLTLYTEQGTLDIKPDKLVTQGEGILTEYKNRTNPYQRENEAFIHAVRTGDTSGIRSSYEDALRTMAVTYAALQSANTGLPVKVASV